MMTRFRLVRECSSLGHSTAQSEPQPTGPHTQTHTHTHTHTHTQPQAHQPLSNMDPGAMPCHPHAPHSVVNHHGLLGGAGDGVVVLEEPQVAAGAAQQAVVGQRIAAVGAGAARVGQCQAEQELCPPVQGQRQPWPCPGTSSPPAPCGPSPEMCLQHAVQTLVEGPGGVVACPVVVLPVRVGEEIPTQHREAGRPHPRHDAHPLVQGIKVIRQRPKLRLRDSMQL